MRAVGRGGKIGIGIDRDFRETLRRTGGSASDGDDVHDVPGHVAGFMHGAQLGDRFGRGFVPDG